MMRLLYTEDQKKTGGNTAGTASSSYMNRSKSKYLMMSDTASMEPTWQFCHHTTWQWVHDIYYETY
jgi:hypothetical protein